MFNQVLNPTGNLGMTVVLALVPVILLLFMLAGLRVTAWLAVLISSVITGLIAILAWHAPVGDSARAYLYGAGTGIWSIDWITFWGLIIFNTLMVTGNFDVFKRWLISQSTADVRVQAILIAWSFGALLEGLVGFGYPWAIVAPLLIPLGIVEIDALRVAAIANNAPVSYGALGVPIVTLAAVTGLPLLAVSASVGRIVAVLALLPPWVLIYLVSGRKGFREGWPLAIVGSLAYIAGQFPVSQFLGPYLPDIVGSLVSFAALLILLKFWRPKTILGYGGVPVVAGGEALPVEPYESERRLTGRQIFMSLMPYLVLVVVVVLGTGPWSPLPAISLFQAKVLANSSITHQPVAALFNFAPFVGGTFVLISWAVIAVILRVDGAMIRQVFTRTFHQMWGALLVGPFIFGLAYVFNFSGMAASLADGFSKIGPAFILLSPILGWIAVALSGSNTSANAIFGAFQMTVGKLLGFPVMLLPSLNSVGAEVGKPVAPQTASVGVSTSHFVRNEGEIIRHNMGWTLVVLTYLIVVGLLYYFVLPAAMRL